MVKIAVIHCDACGAFTLAINGNLISGEYSTGDAVDSATGHAGKVAVWDNVDLTMGRVMGS